MALGGSDPRARRDAQGNLLDGVMMSDPLEIDDGGRFGIKSEGARTGWILGWIGNRWGAKPNRMVTRTQTAAYTAKYGEHVRCDPSGAGFTVTLPASASEGQEIVIKNVTSSANVITISAYGQDLIDGATTANITAAWGSKTFTAVPGGWDVT